MRSKDIEPGRFYKVKVGQAELGLARIERRAEPRYDGDIAVWEGTRWQVAGPFTTHHAAKDIVEPAKPDAKTLRIIAAIEKTAA